MVLSVPYEETVSFLQGTKLGPKAIIDASANVELYDEEVKEKVHTVGIYTAEPINFGNQNSHEKNLEIIEKEFSKLLEMGKFVISLGGEHSMTIGLFKGAHKRFKDVSVLQFDAHADLRSFYGKSKYSHACVMRRIHEITPNIVQVGVRSLSEPEASFIERKKIKVLYAQEMEELSAEEIVERIVSALTEKVYITFDVDYFALDVVRDTGTPEPGGPGWYKTLKILRGVFSRKDVVGMDVVELCGGEGSEISAFNTALLVKKCIAYKFFAKEGSLRSQKEKLTR